MYKILIVSHKYTEINDIMIFTGDQLLLPYKFVKFF